MKKSSKPAEERGRVVEIALRKPIVFNDNVISKARIEIDHINYGLDARTGKLKGKARTNFSVSDIEKFLNLLDGEYLYTDEHRGRISRFRLKVDCPVHGRFYRKLFLMIFETDYNKPNEINTITIFPGW